MAARRLLILMLVLFGLSTVAAALIPVPPPEARTTSSTAEGETKAPPRILERTLRAEARRPRTIELGAGDFLELRILARRVGQIEIPRLGLLEDVGPYDPAIIEVTPPRAGSYPIRLADPPRVLARLEVRAASGCCRRARRSADTSRSR